MIGRPQGRKAMYRASLFSRFAKWAASPVKVMGTRIFRRKGIISWKCVSRDHTQCLSGDISEHVFSVFPINSTCFGTFTGVGALAYRVFAPAMWCAERTLLALKQEAFLQPFAE